MLGEGVRKQGGSLRVCLKPCSVQLGLGRLTPFHSSSCFREQMWDYSVSSVNLRDTET